MQRAPRFPLSLVAAMELAVAMDETLPDAARVVLWARLVKTYGALRMDDLQRLAPERVKMSSIGLVASLLRTKTSGNGKRTRELHLFIPMEAGVASASWLKIGFSLWKAWFRRRRTSSFHA